MVNTTTTFIIVISMITVVVTWYIHDSEAHLGCGRCTRWDDCVDALPLVCQEWRCHIVLAALKWWWQYGKWTKRSIPLCETESPTHMRLLTWYHSPVLGAGHRHTKESNFVCYLGILNGNLLIQESDHPIYNHAAGYLVHLVCPFISVYLPVCFVSSIHPDAFIFSTKDH